MENRPHSRDKEVGQGSADLNRGDKIENGSGPVGNAGRKSEPTPASQKRPSSSGAHGAQRASGGSAADLASIVRALPIKLNLKTILILAVVVIVLVLLLKQCGIGGLFSSLLSLSDIGDAGDYASEYVDNGSASQYTDYKDGQLDRSVDSAARAKYYAPKSGDKVTIMVYMCGTDLESKYGMASSDLAEMASATLSDNVNIIVLTGGCKQWKTTSISNSKNQIYRVVKNGIEPIVDNFSTKAMTDPDNLTSFINYCEKNYPAERKMLVFWDHGGGSVTGYGYDEKNPNSSSMTLAKIASALKKADCRFDVIGFDACLMATLETALVCEPYADYLLASEESEPGTGWYYTRWLSELCANTSKPTIDVGKTLIDDFVTSSSQGSAGAQVTLSLVDLSELHGTVPTAFSNFSTATNSLVSSDYEKVSAARAGVRQFAQSSKINQIDLIDLCNRLDTAEARALADVLEGAIKYNRSTISRSYGLSIYFPYESTSSVNSAVASFNAIGIDSEYTKCIKSFASLGLGGQVAGAASQVTGSSSGDLLGSLLGGFAGGGSSTSPLGALAGSFLSGSGSSATESAGNGLDAASLLGLLGGFSGRSMPAGLEWVDTDLIAANAQQIADAYLDPSHIVVSQKDGANVLSLTEAEWALVRSAELNVFVKDGDGYVDLGTDNVADFNKDGDLILDWDGTWLTVDGHLCAYYLLSDVENEDGSWTTTGRIPAILNGTFVNLQVVFDDAHKGGIVTGSYPLYENGETSAQAKGLIPVRPGDKITLLCDYYKADGSYDSSWTLGEEFVVGAGGLKLTNLKVNAAGSTASYRLTDIFDNHYWTPDIEK